VAELRQQFAAGFVAVVIGFCGKLQVACGKCYGSCNTALIQISDSKRMRAIKKLAFIHVLSTHFLSYFVARISDYVMSGARSCIMPERLQIYALFLEL
jgi:hypothetical protein